MKPKNVISFFNGMNCGRMALEEAGIPVDKYWSFEIDKHAIASTQTTHPDTIQMGSVVDFDVTMFPKIDLFIGGSPCQSFSFAGKRKGMSTKDEQEILTMERYLELKSEGYQFEGQSYLFWEYMRALTELRKLNPDIKFLLENVMMGEKWEKVLSKAIGVEPIEINSALVSAQNRRRLYWTNIGLEVLGLFGDLKSIIEKPKDKGILLKDILENEVDEKYFLKEGSIKKLLEYSQRQKDNGNGFTSKFHEYDEKMSALKVGGGGCDDQVITTDILKINKDGKISPNQDKSSCGEAGGHSGGNHSDMDLIVHNMMPRSSTSGKVARDTFAGVTEKHFV